MEEELYKILQKIVYGTGGNTDSPEEDYCIREAISKILSLIH